MTRGVGIGVAMLAVAVLGVALAAYWTLFAPTREFKPPRPVRIEPGDSMAVAARRLADAGVVRNQWAFIVYAELTGRANRLQPGFYEFHGRENAPQVLDHLVNGDFVVITVAIPEGLTVHQIGERLEAAGLVCAGEFDAQARRGALVKAAGLAPLGAEGYLFPATYKFPPDAGVNDILQAMIARFFANLTPPIERRVFAMGLTVPELVTIASMIEKEAKAPGERPLIASVFYNRLRLGMPLQSDPTAQYSPQGEIAPALLAVHRASPFNTYSIAGLPPGPIANPGLSSIEAALYPAHTDYLYFVARDDGTHIFSRSFAEHQRAIAEVKRSNASSKNRERGGSARGASGVGSAGG
ncbi:endolytic transglycosylase MltG [bacterium]|nr:endolytic transglycosylase MltG [bacterium]